MVVVHEGGAEDIGFLRQGKTLEFFRGDSPLFPDCAESEVQGQRTYRNVLRRAPRALSNYTAEQAVAIVANSEGSFAFRFVSTSVNSTPALYAGALRARGPFRRSELQLWRLGGFEKGSSNARICAFSVLHV